jgi:hypothetical protein
VSPEAWVIVGVIVWLGFVALLVRAAQLLGRWDRGR